MNEIEELKRQGYTGFVTVDKLTADSTIVTSAPGVYIVLRLSSETPEFLNEGTGGFFKGKNPNVEISELQSNWIEDTQIVYIGKATSLKKRLSQYMRFGQGKPIGHWGGRYIWQLKDAGKLIACWKATETPDLASEKESMLIQLFKQEHNGNRPFANLRD